MENVIPQHSLVLENSVSFVVEAIASRRHDWSFGRARLERRVLLDWCWVRWTFSCWSRRISCRSAGYCVACVDQHHRVSS